MRPTRLPRAPTWIFLASFVLFVASWTLGPPPRASSPGEPPRRAAWLPPPISSLQSADVGKQRVVYGTRSRHRVAFTFDDGPHPIYTAKLLRVLERHGAKATFFVNGYWLDRGRSNREAARRVLRQAHSEGHTIGNHTYSHARLPDLPPEQQTWQIVANEVLLSSIIGQRTTIFRPPYGAMTAHATKILGQYGYSEARWNATTHEEQTDPEAIAESVMRWIRAHDGGIVLLHDRLPQVVPAVDLLLTKLHRQNCKRWRQKRPTYRMVSLEAFLEAPSSSWAQARATAAERAGHIAHLARRCAPLTVARRQPHTKP